MSEGTLSQDEIEALLQGTDELISETLGTTQPIESSGVKTEEGLSDVEKARLGDLFKSVCEAQANLIASLTSLSTSFTAPFIDSVSTSQVQEEFKGQEVVQIKTNLSGAVSGEMLYLFQPQHALTIGNVMIGHEGNTEFTEVIMSALAELSSNLASAMVTVLTDRLKKHFATGAPSISRVPGENISFPQGAKALARITYSFTMEGKPPFRVYTLLPVNMAKSIVQMYMSSGFESSSMQPQTSQMGVGEVAQPQVAVKPVAYQPLLQGIPVESQQNLGLLLDVMMQVTVELGRTKMLMKDILGLGEGSIIELDKLAGEPVDILVNGKLIAKGEVVVIDENFGVRITEIINPMERFIGKMES